MIEEQLLAPQKAANMSRETIKKTATESSSKLGAASGKNGATRQADILETVCRQENISGLDSDQFKEFSKLVKPVLADSLEQRDFQVTGNDQFCSV